MTLTKTDIDQIRKVVREEVEVEVVASSHNLRSQINSLHVDIIDVKGHTKTNEILARGSEKRLIRLEVKIDKNHKEIKGEIKQVVDFLDKNNLSTLSRVKRLEKHTGLPPPSQN